MGYSSITLLPLPLMALSLLAVLLRGPPGAEAVRNAMMTGTALGATPSQCIQGEAPVQVLTSETIQQHPSRDAQDCAAWCGMATNYTFYSFAKTSDICSCHKDFMGVVPLSTLPEFKDASAAEVMGRTVAWGSVPACVDGQRRGPQDGQRGQRGHVDQAPAAAAVKAPVPREPFSTSPAADVTSPPAVTTKASPQESWVYEEERGFKDFTEGLPGMRMASLDFIPATPGLQGYNSVDNFVSTNDLYVYNS